MEKVICFNKNGYDPFIDFIKAYAIICVLLGHTFPYHHETGYSLWYGMQVPLFILVQVFHVFKKGKYSFSFQKIIIRVFLPFLLVQLCLFLVLLLFTDSGNTLINSSLMGGGIGPGSYYPWIFLQFALILPIIKPLVDKINKMQITIIVLFVSIALEILSSLIHLPDSIYRLLAVRYLFIIYLGWIWVRDGIIINANTLLLSLLSLLTIVYFDYFYVNTEPWFYNTAWKTHRWPCYFYVSTLLTYILYVIYNKTKQVKYIDKATKMLARCSYEIFLIQMAVIPLCPSLGFIPNTFLRFIIRFIIIWGTSITGGYYFNMIYSSLTHILNGKNNG